MLTSDSEDFESADEGVSTPHKKERKKRLSSSNYSDNMESDQETKIDQTSTNIEAPNKQDDSGDGWDIFEFDEVAQTITNITKKEVHQAQDTKPSEQNSGWDDFDDWGDDNSNSTVIVKDPPKPQDTKDAPKTEGWGWGWGMDSLLSTATAGISTITTQVSQGISTVLETGIGAPDPEELARRAKSNESITLPVVDEQKESQAKPEDNSFQFGSLFSGVTKFVETTGTKVIAGGLDTLETIGKKTMEVLQDGDPGLAKKRAMLGLDADKPVLSQVLKEAKAKADEEDMIREAKKEAKEIHYETLFDDFEGLVHLEALEMLSKQVSMRIEERLRSVDPEKRQDIKETLQQVAELCEMPEEDDEEEDELPEDMSKPDAFHERLQRATRDIGLKLQFQPLIKQHTETLTWLDTEENLTDKAIYKKAVSALAHNTALCVELYHKTAEMLLVKNRRSTADEADALTQMTVVLTKQISDLATQFTEKLSAQSSEDTEQINNYITNVFLEAGNSSKYIENAFQLALPIVQIGAV